MNKKEKSVMAAENNLLSLLLTDASSKELSTFLNNLYDCWYQEGYTEGVKDGNTDSYFNSREE